MVKHLHKFAFSDAQSANDFVSHLNQEAELQGAQIVVIGPLRLPISQAEESVEFTDYLVDMIAPSGFVYDGTYEVFPTNPKHQFAGLQYTSTKVVIDEE